MNDQDRSPRLNRGRERGFFELYGADPERADAIVFGRRTPLDRRGFLKGAGLASLGAALGAIVPFARHMPSGLVPVAFAAETDWVLQLSGAGLTVLNDRPINAETPAHLLDDGITPSSLHFVRNNGLMPEHVDSSEWSLNVDGDVIRPTTFSIRDLRRNFPLVKAALLLECGGNGRAGYNPPARGNQWTTGAVANSYWTGVRYRDVLNAVGLKPSAIYTGHYSTDRHPSGDPEKLVISRGVPIAKAMQSDTLIAFEMNGEPIPLTHGAPLRVVVPGWPGSASQKWLNRISIRDQVHDGPKMTGKSYRVPSQPVPPGAEVDNSNMRIIEAMPVKSLITRPETGYRLKHWEMLRVGGHAWAGDHVVTKVEISIDFGATWRRGVLKTPPNRGSWQNWSLELKLPGPGYYEIWARATDDQGIAQPMLVPGWNPRGYLNNSLHRIAVTAI